MTLKTSLVISGDAAGATAAIASADAGLAQLEQGARRVAAANDQMATSSTRALGQTRAGYTQLGQQVQDVAVQLQSGTNLGTIIAQQGGQIATAVQQMGGRFSGLAGFLAGPWGAAVTVGAGVLINMAMALRDNTSAAEAAEKATEGFAKRLGDMASFFDLSTGAILRQNVALIENARLKRLDQIDEARARQNERGARIRQLVAGSAEEEFENRGSAMDPLFVSAGRDMSLVNAIKKAGGDQKKINQALFELARGKGAQARLARQILDERGQAAFESGEIRRLGLEEESLRTGRLADELRRGSGTKRSPGGRKRSGDGGAAARAEFGEDTANKIAKIRDQFSDLPSAVRQANEGLRQLDDIASDIERRKPVDAPKLTAEIGTVRQAIEASLNKPFNEFIQKQRESAAIDQLRLQGREDEAEAMKIVLAQQIQQGPLSAQQLAAVLATVEAERRRSLVLRDQRALIQANLDAVYDMRGALEQTFADALRGRFSLGNVFAAIGNSWINMTARRLVEDMFGGALRGLEEQASGAGRIEAANDALAKQVIDTGTELKSLAQVISEVRAEIAGSSPAAASAGDVAVPGAASVDADGSLTVTGSKPSEVISTRTSDMITAQIQVLMRGLGAPDGLAGTIGDIMKKVLGKLETSLPEIMKGALLGSAAGSILGDRGSSLGGAIGGAIGQQVGKSVFKSLGSIAGPLGSIVGGLLGSLLGGLFQKTKIGTATIGNVDGRAKITGTGGNDQQRITGARGLASGALDALDQIISSLSGDLGNFSASIGIRKKKFVLDPTGQGRTKGRGTREFETEAEAQAALLADIISDGAVQGLSAAVERALRSSPDVQRGLKEALKVQEVELLVGGLGAQIAKQLKDFERQAAERVRIAREYGFDLVKLEERNAKDRLKLTEKLLADQVGSLQSLIDEMTSGALFEGSSVDRRKALLDQVAAAKAAADAGEEGAADKLASLLEQLNAVSKEAFGTTGGFASDRQTILDAARDTIAKANRRITDARASDPALALTNAALDENNGQNAQMIALLASLNASWSGSGGASGMSLREVADAARTN